MPGASLVQLIQSAGHMQVKSSCRFQRNLEDTLQGHNSFEMPTVLSGNLSWAAC